MSVIRTTEDSSTYFFGDLMLEILGRMNVTTKTTTGERLKST